MLTPKKIISTIACIGIVAVACTKSFKKTKSGIEYKIHEHGKEKRKINPGDVVSFHFTMRNGKDSILMESIKRSPEPLTMPIDSPTTKDPIQEGIMLLSKGDSATLKFMADSIFKEMKGALPPGIEKGSMIAINIKIHNVQTKSEKRIEMEKEEQKMREQIEKQKSIDDQLIQDYLKKNNITATKTSSGLYYIIDKKGAGQKPTPGDSVSVNYTGKLLDGTPFDSNTDPLFKHMQPLKLMVGIGQVIPGWDEGLLLLPEGSKGRFFIPSGLAYQNQQAGPLIKPFSILVFDVELLDVKKLHLKK